MATDPDKPGSPARSGVFHKVVDPRTVAFTQSVSFDHTLARHDIAGSVAHARMLAKVGLLSRDEVQAIVQGLLEIKSEIEAGRFVFRPEYEDVHMNIEKALEERIGDPAGKLHTARSRNDQVALDERLWVREEMDQTRRLLTALQRAFLELAERHAADVMPGYTHLQRAQPVTCGHYLLAYVEMLERDKGRFADARARANVLPLGAGALAGTSLPIDRRHVARLLRFDGVTRNSMDTTADRDYLIEFAAAQALCAVHLSRLGEDFVLFATAEFSFLELDDAFATGSSLMPQKRNPDILELVRGKTGRALGCLVQLLTLVKGLPLTYNRDLQEDKELLFETTRQFQDCLRILESLLHHVSFRRERMAAACESGYMDATALAEQLVRYGLPFRQAHHIAGTLVRRASEKGVPLAGLEDSEWRQVHAFLDAKARAVLGAAGVVKSYASSGSANPVLVHREVEAWRTRLAGRPAKRGKRPAP